MAANHMNLSVTATRALRSSVFVTFFVLLLLSGLALAVPSPVDDFASGDEDTVIQNIDVSDNDGPDAIANTVTLNTQATNGTATLNPNNTFDYTPNQHYFGLDSFTYSICDSIPECAIATVNIAVNSVNDLPVLTLNGSATVNLGTGDTYNEQGASASDVEDGDISADVLIGGETVDTSTTDTYTVTYNVTDSDGGSATQISRDVIVTDDDPPVITLSGANPLNLSAGDTFVEPGYSATDNVDGDLTGDVVIGGDTVDTGTPGTYVITYNVSDAAGNSAAQVTRTVNVTDDGAPVITLLGANPLNLSVGDTFVEPGYTATDDVDGDLTGSVVVGGDTVDTGTAGTYVITYNVSDAAGNAAAEATRTVNVTDSNPPVITLLGDNPLDLNVGDAYIDPGATATDPEEGDISANIVVGGDTVNTSVAGTYVVTYNVSDSAGNAAAEVTRTVTVNAPPTASNVSIVGDPSLGSTLTGTYSYADREGDLEGASTYRWLRDGTAIPGATGLQYTVVSADIETNLRFEVTPVAAAGAPTGLPVQSADFRISNSAPSITGQQELNTDEDTSLVITLSDITVTDLDSTFPDDFTLTVQGGANYTFVGNTVTPELNFNGVLTVPITVNDGFVDSAVFDLTVTVLPVNDQPVISGLVAALSTDEDTSLTILVTDLVIDDPDDTVHTLALRDGTSYTRSDNTITPDENFNGQLSVPATVFDAELLESQVVNLLVTVVSVNDVPTLAAEIDDQTAIENSPFDLDVTGNFTDVEGDNLSYSASWSPAKPPNIDFDGGTGVFSGTPRDDDAEPPGPVYTVTVTATDPSGDFVTDTFDLTIALLDRANLSLGIDVTPDTGLPNDELRWTFTVRNPIGPQPGDDVRLTGSIVGVGLSVAEQGSSTCTIQPEVNNQIDFECLLGALPVGGSTSTVLAALTSQATEVVAFATAEGANPVPIDPNLDDNSDVASAGVAESFSVGAVQILGNATVRSVAAGDINGDGRADMVIGTAAGQFVQVFVNDANRESCDCLRDFVRSPISIPDTGSNEGVALADFDNNGTLDLIVANGGGQPDMVYSNDGAGNFTSMATLGNSFAQGVAVGDFNNDGNMDIAFAAVGPNPVYLGDGIGGFSLDSSLGDGNSTDVAAASFDGDSRTDLAFANVGGDSRVWTKNAGAGFSSQDTLPIGDAMAVAAGDMDGDGDQDLVFGRVPSATGDIPSNPVLLNDGSGNFGSPVEQLGISPTEDVLIGDVNRDGSADIVFINASGVHQTWLSSNSYTLHSEQIIDQDARAGVLVELGDADNGNAGGVDLAMGGASSAGIGVYLNDGSGNLGRGDDVPPVITLLGEANVVVTTGSYTDAGATALDNIDGDVTANIVVTSTVNTTIVGNYTVTYNVEDFAGNQATTVVRNVEIAVASGGGGGGGGALSLGLLAALAGLLVMPIIRMRED